MVERVSITAERSPYLVEEVLVVQPGATLAIEPGVVIWFKARGMVVRGSIVVQGSAERLARSSGAAGGR